MKSLTLHNIDEPLLTLVRENARIQKKSINQYLKEIIEHSLGYKKTSTPKYHDDFNGLCGVWSIDERFEFDDHVKEFEHIDQEDWQ